MSFAYRPDIDGLRAVAVLSVLVYHAEFALGPGILLEGGFLGVDIFFVISGFLITSLIVGELQATGRFSIANFYERRVRRLLPALLAIMLVFLPIAWWHLLPGQLVDFARSLIASLLFGSNVYWNSMLQVYGAESASLKPFLNTWSLAVEEQYYLVYPLLLVAVHARWKRHIVSLLAAGLVCSLLFAHWMTARDASWSFYMLPSRLWELLAGGTLACALHAKPLRFAGTPLARWMPIAGLLLIAYAIAFVELGWHHPGLVTLLPVAGTVLVIAFAREDDIVTRLLSSPLCRGIGLVSYSLYLWHYPVFAFARMRTPSPSVGDRIAWIALVLVLSVLTYLLVEKPFRNRKAVSARALAAMLLLPTAGIAHIAIQWIQSDGASRSLPAIIASIDTDVENSRICTTPGGPDCTFNPQASRDLILVGDSHMFPLERPLLEFSKTHDYRFTVLNDSGCPYVPDMDRVNRKGGTHKRCSRELQQTRHERMLSGSAGIVVIGGRWPLILSEQGFDNREGGDDDRAVDFFQYADASLEDAVNRRHAVAAEYRDAVLELAQHGHKVVLLYPVPEVGWNVPARLARLLAGKSPYEIEKSLVTNPVTTSYDVYRERSRESFRLLDGIRHPNIFRVYPHALFCDRQIPGRCVTHDTSVAYYRDDNHLTAHGARLLMELIMRSPAFDE